MIDRIPEKKRAIVIQSLIDEYSKEGYKNASTNIIVSAAGISKGSLFNYVGNKKEQYCFIIGYLIDFLLEKLSSYMEELERSDDYFEMILEKSKVKIQLALEYPKEYKLLMDAYLEEDEEIQVFMKEKGAAFAQNKVLNDKSVIDPSKLKNPEDGEKISEMVFFLISGYTESILKGYKVEGETIPHLLEKMTIGLEVYFNMLRKGFFKEEETSDF